MGARIAAQLYENQYISREEALYLLTFCNNIGPLYYVAIVLQGIRPAYGIPSMLGMYGIPLLYGLCMRYTLYGNLTFHAAVEKQSLCNRKSIVEALDNSVNSSLCAIAALGGYMILFNALAGIVSYLLSYRCKSLAVICCMNSFIEISSGIQSTLNTDILFPWKESIILVPVMFGGLSCLAQTASCTRALKASLFPYCIHKLVQALLFGLYMNLLYHL